MRSRFVALAMFLFSAAALGHSAHADDPAFTYGSHDDVKDVKKEEWSAKVEAGLVATTGNSKTTTATLGANAARKMQDNKFEMSMTGTYARATTRTAADANGDGVISQDELSEASATAAKNFTMKLRYDRFLTDFNSLYVAASGGFDQPAGKDFIGGGQVGYSRRLYKDDDHEVVGEVGYDISYLRLATDTSTTIHSGRAFTGYKGKLSKDTGLEASVELLLNVNSITIGDRTADPLKDTRINGTVGVTTQLRKNVSLTFSFLAKFDNFPAPLVAFSVPFAPGFEPAADKLDTITKASLIVSFL